MNDWKHYIIDSATGNYLYWNGTAVASSVDPVEIPEGPEGWDGISILWERDMSKPGVVRSFTVPLSYINDGAKIIASEFYGNNIERKLLIKIQKRKTEYTGIYLRHNYIDFYSGEIDLTSFKDDGVKITVTVSEGGIIKKIKASESTAQELPMESNFIKVLLDGFNIDYSGQMTLLQDSYSATTIGSGNQVTKNYATYYNTSTETKRVYIALFDVIKSRYSNSSDLSALLTSDQYFLITTEDITGTHFNFVLKGVLNKANLGSSTAGLDVYIRNQNGVIKQTLYSNHLSGGTTSIPVNVSLDFDLDLLKNEKLFLSIEMFANHPGGLYSASDTGLIFGVTETNTKISYKTKFKQTIVKAKLPSQVFKELTGAITGNELDADTTFVQTKDYYALSPGDSVRGLINVVMKTHLNDFSTFAKVVMRGGFGIINDKAVIKDYADFFSTSLPIQLQVKNLVITDATDQRINTLKIGYPDQNIDDINGKYEYNNTHVYDTPVKSVTREANFVCPYLAQPFLIETTRINLDGKTTTDNTSDNNIFILHIDIDNPLAIDGEIVYPLKRDPSMFVEGVPDTANMFNLFITPKQLLKLHKPLLNSLLYGFDGQDIVFKSTEKNHDLKTTLGSDVVDEDANEVIGTDKLFLPFYLDVDTNVPVDLVQRMSSDPNVCFSFGQGGEGFITKAGIQPETKQEQSYKMLCSPSVDIKNLQANAYK